MRICLKSWSLRTFSTLAKEPAGTVYTWSSAKKKPEKLNVPEKITRVSLGQNHSALVSESGHLYTYGNNKFGQLGHGDTTALKVPKLVEYFANKNIHVKQALCGDNHTVVLTQDNRVYSFGNGGKKRGSLWNFYNIFAPKASPLGHGTQDNISQPKEIKYFQGKQIERITTGQKFNFAVDQLGHTFFWGNGEYGVVGDGSTKSCNVPRTNEYFDYLQQEEGITISKMKSCGTHSLCLMTNGMLYGWGSNHAGQIGIKNEIGIELHEMVNFPHLMIREGYEDCKVTNFDTSENMCIFQLNNGEIWWTGGHIAFKPEKTVFEESGNVKLFAAGTRSFAIVSNSNNIYTQRKFITASKEEEDIKTNIVKIKGESLFDGQIVGIGGEYENRYAIIA